MLKNVSFCRYSEGVNVKGFKGAKGYGHIFLWDGSQDETGRLCLEPKASERRRFRCGRQDRNKVHADSFVSFIFEARN